MAWTLERRENTCESPCTTKPREAANLMITQYVVTNIVFFYEIMRTVQVWGNVGGIQTKEMSVVAYEMVNFFV